MSSARKPDRPALDRAGEAERFQTLFGLCALYESRSRSNSSFIRSKSPGSSFCFCSIGAGYSGSEHFDLVAHQIERSLNPAQFKF
jgi:hypothetical protein